MSQEVLGTRDFSNPFSVETLVKEMHENDHEPSHFRMTPERFDHILSLLGPMLSKKYLHREPISSDERLTVTLRLLVTGDSLQMVSFSYRLGHTTVSRIIPEVYDAL